MSWRCPHRLLISERGECESCNADIAGRASPTDMFGEAREAEVLMLLNEASAYRFDDVHQRLEALVGRPVWTHEFAQDLALAIEARSWNHPPDLATNAVSSLRALADDKPIIVVEEPL